MTVNKDEALQQWIQSNIGKETTMFNFLELYAGSYAVVPISAEAIVTPYIDGSAYKKYDFALQTMQPLSQTTDSVNTDVMLLCREWQDWIDEQERQGNYPNFGDKCFGYRLLNGSNMPQLAMAYTEEQMAKFQLVTVLYYTEVR